MIHAKITAFQNSKNGRAPWVLARSTELGSFDNPAGQVLVRLAPFLWHEGYEPKAGDDVLLEYRNGTIEMVGRIITRFSDCGGPRR